MKSSNFRSMLETRVPLFLAQVSTVLLDRHSLDVSSLVADHVCWRTETAEDYSELVHSLKKDPKNFQLLIESEIGGRPIATFQTLWSPPLLSATGGHQVNVVEIPSPKNGSPYKEGLEHVEFVIGNGTKCETPWNNDHHQIVLTEFMAEHPRLEWSCKAQHKEINPDISLKIQAQDVGKCSVKFHLMPLTEVIEKEKQQALEG